MAAHEPASGASRFGIFLVPTAADTARTIAHAELADQRGLELVGIQDHPYQRRFLDTFALIANLAARTTKVTLVPDVANLPLRRPAMLAKAAATIDLLSNGRFELGLGAGAFWDGIEAMGGTRLTPKQSVDQLEKAIAEIRDVWSGGSKYFGPPPDHPIGIWLGAYGPRMIRLTGTAADGWLPSVPRLPLDEIPERQTAINEAAKAAGRDPSDIRRVANVNGTITTGERNGFLKGPAGQWVDDLRRLHTQYGFQDFIFWGEGDPDDQFRRFAEDVAPRAREALTAV
jgi:alkanesulfonate monooxygenase SsuD/methylene tetrahydromethanopterin reductase-like flavin-dependent oxidoreductase (luciferase family)